MLSFAGTMARFSGRAGDGLYTALRDALVERRMPLSFLATDADEVSLDPHYVRCVSRSSRPQRYARAGIRRPVPMFVVDSERTNVLMFSMGHHAQFSPRERRGR